MVVKEQTKIAVRLPSELVRAVDGFAREESKKLGIAYTRTDAVRVLLAKALMLIKLPKEKKK